MTNEKFKVLLLAASYESLRFGSDYVTIICHGDLNLMFFPTLTTILG
jgi:hypothetical protein